MPYSDELKEKYIKQLNPRETCALKIAKKKKSYKSNNNA